MARVMIYLSASLCILCALCANYPGVIAHYIKNSETETIKLGYLNTKQVDEVVALRKEIALLQERATKLETVAFTPEKGLTYNTDIAESRDTPRHVLSKRDVFRRVRRRAPEVAFLASLTKDYATFKLHDAIIFSDVITNIGGAYNKHTGIFTAPLAGTYTFYTNIVSDRGHYVEASIQVNDKAIVSAISDHRISSRKDYFDKWDQGNAVAILRLRRGDKVCVSVQWPQGSHDIHGVGKSSFSGYLLRAHGFRSGS